MRYLNQFLFQKKEASTILTVFYPSVLIYALIHFIFRDWSLYQVAHELYQPLTFMPIPMPTPSMLTCLKLLLLVIGILQLSKFRSVIGGMVFFMICFLFDYWHNMFGFINAEIHLIFFLLLLSFFKKDSPYASYIFRFCELIVVLVYFQSGLAKLLVSGWDWAIDGTTLQIAWYRQQVGIGIWLSQFSLLAKIASFSALLFELSFAFYYFLTVKWRERLLFISILFHLTTWFTMGIDFSHLWIFQFSYFLSKCIPLLKSKHPRFLPLKGNT